ncbi:MAG TPA: ATP-binding protein [Candidatus Altiarchaeales archaeon]|nr:ATP-binding protein [Candidatus Altiarchaeales archaeon]
MDFQDISKQNPWWASPSAINDDPKIRDFDLAKFKWNPRLRKYLNPGRDILYSVRGPRQVGKTTLVKLIIREELKTRNPADILYYSCDLLTKFQELSELFEIYLKWAGQQSSGRKLIVIDEISRVENWEYAYKHIVDTYGLEGKTFILTGSSCWDIKHGVERLPGRKGEACGEQNHKILLPMKFAEYVQLRSPQIHQTIEKLRLNDNAVRRNAFNDLTTLKAGEWINPILPHLGELETLLLEYFITGGVMTAVNQYARDKQIKNSTYELYLQLFFGDLVKLKRDESTAKKVLTAVLKHAPAPIGWTKIQKTMDIPQPVTVAEYAEVLKTLFVLNIYHAFDRSKNRPKHRSEKKLQIPNPFFFHAFRGYLENPAGDYFKQAIDYIMNGGKTLLAEFVTGDHLARCAYNAHPSDLYDQSNSVFYEKNNSGESIDFILRLPEQFLPIKVKYQNTINSSDYKHIKKHKTGILITKNTIDLVENYPAIPLHLFLLFI